MRGTQRKRRTAAAGTKGANSGGAAAPSPGAELGDADDDEYETMMTMLPSLDGRIPNRRQRRKTQPGGRRGKALGGTTDSNDDGADDDDETLARELIQQAAGLDEEDHEGQQSDGEESGEEDHDPSGALDPPDAGNPAAEDHTDVEEGIGGAIAGHD